MRNAQLNKAYIFSDREEVVSTLRRAIRSNGVPAEGIQSKLSVDRCIDMLAQNKDALLVVDWDRGISKILKIFDSEKQRGMLGIRPTILISSQIDPKVIATASEYNISVVQAGQLTQTSIQILIADAAEEYASGRPINELRKTILELRESGRKDEIIQLLAKSFEQDESCARIAADYSNELIATENWELALKVLEPFAGLEPPDPRILHMIGRCYLKLKRPGEAVHHLSKAKLISPYNVDRLIELGEAYLGIEEVKKAQRAFGDAMKLAPHRSEAEQGAGKCHLLQGELNEGLRLIRQSSDDRELASIFNSVAVTTVQSFKYDKAMRLYDSALAVLKGSTLLQSRLFFNKALAYYRWGRPVDAVDQFEKALHLDPEYSDAAHNLSAMKLRIAKGLALPHNAALANSRDGYHIETEDYADSKFDDDLDLFEGEDDSLF